MKTATPSDPTAPVSDSTVTVLPASAQQQIDALRAAIDIRLAALETVLADPRPDESLESLILDLARLATEEARATATRACAGIKLEADTEIAQARKSAQQAIEHERIVSLDFRRSLEQAQQRHAALERDKQNELRALRDQFESKLAEQRGGIDGLERTAANLERQAAETRQLLEAERQTTAALRQEIAAQEALVADAGRAQAEGQKVVAQAHAEVQQERQRAAEVTRSHSATQAELAAERATTAELRGAVERLRGQAATFERDLAEAKKGHGSIDAELARERQLAAELEQRLRQHEKLLEDERTATADLRRAIAKAEEHGVAVGREHAQSQAAAKSTLAELERERQAVADLGRAQTALKTQVDKERALTRELRGTIERLEAEIARAADDTRLNVAGQDELREALLAARGSAAQLHGDLESERTAAKQLRTRLDELEARASRADHERAKQAAEQDELRQALAAARTERQTLVAQVDTERRIAEEARGRIAQLSEQLAGATADASAVVRATEQLARAQAEVRTLGGQLDAEQATARELRAHADRLTEQLAAAGSQVAGHEQLRQALAAAQSEAGATRTQLEAEQKTAHELRGRTDQLTRELAAATRDAAVVSELRQALAANDGSIKTLRDELAAERQTVKELRQRFDESETRLLQASDESAQQAAGHQELREALLAARKDLHKLQQDLEHERAAVADAGAHRRRQEDAHTVLQQELNDARSRTEALLATIESERGRIQALERAQASAEDAWKEAETRLEQLARERERLAAELAIAREALADTAPPAGKSAPQPAAPAVAAKADTRTHDPEPQAPMPPPVASAKNKPLDAVAMSDDGWSSVRLSTRYAFRDKLEIQLNTGVALLCDLSIGGCQLLSRGALKPKQSVKIGLPSGDKTIGCTGKVIWARLEPPAMGQPLSYRAGVQFSNADQTAIEAFLKSHGVEI